MGLAPYGEPKYVDRILDHLIDLKDDGSFRLDMSLLQLLPGPDDDRAPKFHELFGGPPQAPRDRR